MQLSSVAGMMEDHKNQHDLDITGRGLINQTLGICSTK